MKGARAAPVAQRFSAACSLGRDPGDVGSSPTSGSCMEPVSHSACVSASLSLSLSLCVFHEKIKKIFIKNAHINIPTEQSYHYYIFL